MFGLIRRLRCRWLSRREFPLEWLTYLRRHVPFYRQLPDELRQVFLDRLKIFAWEKCSGQKVKEAGLYFTRVEEYVRFPAKLS